MPAPWCAGTAYARGMRIAVTGGSGKLGRHVVDRLRESGHDVVNLDTHGERWSGWIAVDLTDYGQVVDALGGVQGEQPAGGCRGAPRGDPRTRAALRRRDLPQQPC